MTSASPLGFGARETPPPVLRVVSAVLAMVLLPPQLDRRPEDAFDRDEPLFDLEEPPFAREDDELFDFGDELFDFDALPLLREDPLFDELDDLRPLDDLPPLDDFELPRDDFEVDDLELDDFAL